MKTEEDVGMTPEQMAFYRGGLVIITCYHNWSLDDVFSGTPIDDPVKRLALFCAGNLSASKGSRQPDPDFQRDLMQEAFELAGELNLNRVETLQLAIKIWHETEAVLNGEHLWAAVSWAAYQLLGKSIFTKEELAELRKQVQLQRMLKT